MQDFNDLIDEQEFYEFNLDLSDDIELEGCDDLGAIE